MKPLLSPVYCLALLAALGGFAGCSSLTPYKIEVVQGNFVSKEQLAALKPGMSRQQVRAVLGSPLVTSVFHADRWDYVFTIKRQGVAPQLRKLTVFFNGNVYDRAEGDELISEAEFVAQLDVRRKGKVPELQASEESLKKFAPPAKPATAQAQAEQTTAPARTNYPPLELR